MLNDSDRRLTEWTDSNIKSINNLNCSEDGQPGHSFLKWKCWQLILWRSFFCKLLFCYDSLENLAGIGAFEVLSLSAAKQKYLITIFKMFPLIAS